VRNLMMSRGYTEVMTYSFLPENFAKFLKLDENDLRARPLLIANPISRDQMAMRTTLIMGLLNGLKNSILSGWRGAVRIFEQGRVFLRKDINNKDYAEHVEFNKVAGLLFNGVESRDIYKQPEDFYSMKADVKALIEGRGFNEIIFEASRESFAHSGQTASVSVIIDNNKVNLGFIAALKPSLVKELDVNGNIYIFELDLTPLEATKRPVLKPASLYPASTRDISLLVNKAKSSAQVERDIRDSVKAAASLNNLNLNILENLKLFDVYQGKGIPEGFVSLAYSLSYRLNDRTLKDDEVESLHNSVRENLTQKGYSMR
ncbi:MAG: phenylalanine--tRNA ligase subunit beta, partial [Synergistaceae bacterium]|nr:phenylalanine--tRNA ligase subunit beta [Synergistaceae bacterium]